MAIVPLAKCAVCGWSQQAQSDDPEEIVRVAVAFEDHLARDHDMTWARARETAREWLGKAIEARQGQP
jgi:hypothetical protein